MKVKSQFPITVIVEVEYDNQENSWSHIKQSLEAVEKNIKKSFDTVYVGTSISAKIAVFSPKGFIRFNKVFGKCWYFRAEMFRLRTK